MPEEEQGSDNAQSVLIVGDDEAALKALTLRIQARGWQITSTTDPHKAQARFQAQSTTVALLDIDMSGLNAVDLARNLRRDSPNLIVIFMTGFPGLSQAIEGVHQVAYDYLVKPFRIEQLVLIVNRARRELALLRENRALIETVGRLQTRLEALTTTAETDRIEPREQEAPEESPLPETKSPDSLLKTIPGSGYDPIGSYARQMHPSPSPVAQGNVTRPGAQQTPATPSGEDTSAESEQPRDNHAE